MNLEDISTFRTIDSENMIEQINGLPQQLLDAWRLGQTLPLPTKDGLRNIVIAGMGSSAVGAELLAAYVSPVCPLPVTILRDYDLPAWARGPQTLVIASSYSGETEETLSVFAQAKERGCTLMVISTGGQLVQAGKAAGAAVWQFEYAGQPRAALGYAFGLPLAAFFRLGLIPDPTGEMHEALHDMRNQQSSLHYEVPVALNPAKRLAGQLVGRVVVVFGADYLAPVARRWKNQIAEIAKSCGQIELLPEFDHNTLAGFNHPEAPLSQMMALFLNGAGNHPRNHQRLDATRQMLMMMGMNTDFVQAKGEGSLAQIWTLLHFGDYTSYYLAMAYGEDPTPVDALTMMQQEISNHK